jgi:hypothetical protein
MRFIQAAILVGILFQAPPATAVIIAELDNFEDIMDPVEGWMVGSGLGSGHPAPPSNQLGGPAGAMDNFLLLTSIAPPAGVRPGPGSRLGAFNVSQWSGDYIAAGVDLITMDVRNFGDVDLSLRLALAVSVMPDIDVAVSTDAVVLPAMSDWTSVEFPIGPGNLTALAGTVDAALMSMMKQLWIFHDVTLSASFRPDVVTAQLGVDNITAARSAAGVIPEPWSLIVWGLLALTAGGLSKFHRSR